MTRGGQMPSQSTFPCTMDAAANIAVLEMGKSFHACAIKSLVNYDVFVGNSLISFYAKCGSVEDSLLVFYELPERNIVSWNAVLCGFAQNRRGEDAVNFYERMGDTGLRPNSVSLLGLLWAFNHAGLVDKRYSYFNQARLEYPRLLKPEHYACVVDLLSRGGRFKEALGFLNNLSFHPGIGCWKASLGGCQIHSNMEMGVLAAQRILALDPEDVSSYITLSNAHSAAGRWQDVSTIRKETKEKEMKTISGCRAGLKLEPKYVFVKGDRNHHQKDEIHIFLKFVYRAFKTEMETTLSYH